jgi:predicted RNase H-like HicB family nuclease
MKVREYRYQLLITKDVNGVFSAVVLNLPGIGSCGDTEEAAIENAKDAIRLALEVYEESHEEIPWKDLSSITIPEGAKLLRIILDA